MDKRYYFDVLARMAGLTLDDLSRVNNLMAAMHDLAHVSQNKKTEMFRSRLLGKTLLDAWRRHESGRLVPAHGKPGTNVKVIGPPRFWNLFGYVFSHRIKSRIFEPALNEMIEDYLLARKDCRTQWARRWLNFCFNFRMVLTVLECFRVVIADRAFRSLARLLPEPIRRWWMLL